jgi:digeranylgeranylglycerophospholipid reductase
MMSNYYDVIVAGGSISGLLAAREVAAANNSVVVFEEDSEIGTPQHCGGLVSLEGLKRLRVLPGSSVIECKIREARVFSPSSSFVIDSINQKVISVDRRSLDKQVALQAQRNGAEIRTRCSVRWPSEERQLFEDGDNTCGSIKTVLTSDGEFRCRYLIDSRGVSSVLRKHRGGILQSAQYEVYASWIKAEIVEINFDNDKYPGFFAWIIPVDDGVGRVGVAGRGINPAEAINSFMNSKGRGYSITRKVFAPIWVSGPIEDFVVNNTVIVGDAAGQTKPTTAGGIYSCGMGGILAGRAITNAIRTNDVQALSDYQKGWMQIFKAEFDKMLLARRILERIDNQTLDQIFDSVSDSSLKDLSLEGNFDFHSSSLTKVLGTKHGLKIMKAILGNEIRRLWS